MQALPGCSQSSSFSGAEKLVRDFAQAMTDNRVKVSDSLFIQLQALFDPVKIVEITAVIAWENYRKGVVGGFHRNNSNKEKCVLCSECSLHRS